MSEPPATPDDIVTSVSDTDVDIERSVAGRVTSLWSFTGKYRILHLTWFAFFLTFVVWFNFAPFANTIAEQLGLSDAEEKTIALCNVALTVPARVFIGMALDRWGPRSGLRGHPDVRGDPEHRVRVVHVVHDTAPQPVGALGRGCWVRGRRPDGLRMVPAE